MHHRFDDHPACQDERLFLHLFKTYLSLPQNRTRLSEQIRPLITTAFKLFALLASIDFLNKYTNVFFFIIVVCIKYNIDAISLYNIQ